MISIEQIKELQQRVDTLGRCIDIDAKRAEVAEKTERTLAPDFWDDPKEAEKFLKELSGVKFWVTGFDKLLTALDDLNVLLEFEDEEIDKAYASAVGDLEALELRNMLGEEGDNLGAVLTINSGAGGTEANDWSAMLMRMYVRWAMMVRNNMADGLVAGSIASTADMLRAAFHCIGTAPGIKSASSTFVMDLADPTESGDDVLLFSDCIDLRR